MTQSTQKIRRFVRSLRTDTSGLAMIEFAYALPMMIGVTFFGLEMTNLAMVSHKVSQAASAMADNMSRVGLLSVLSTTQIRESDVNDSFIGVVRQTEGLELMTRGRVIISSLQQNASGGQWIAWQRCLGTKNVASSYGVQGDGATGTAFPGMGPASARVQAPPGSAVMVTEIIYDYKPLFSTMFIPARTLRYHASYIVRDERDLTQIYNPNPAASVKACNVFTSS